MAKNAAGYADTAGFDGGTQIISTRANDFATGGGQIYLNGSTGNRIDSANVGTNPPSYTSRSIGTKVLFWSSVEATNVDYAIGLEK